MVTKFLVCQSKHSCGPRGSEHVLRDIEELCGGAATVIGSSCLDHCGRGPNVEVHYHPKTQRAQQVIEGVDSFRKIEDLVKMVPNARIDKLQRRIALLKYDARRAKSSKDRLSKVQQGFRAIGGEGNSFKHEPRLSSQLLVLRSREILSSRKDNSAALGDAEQAVRLDPKAAHAHIALSLALESSGRFKEALEAMEVAGSLGSGSMNWSESLHIQHRLTKQIEELEAESRKGCEAETPDAMVSAALQQEEPEMSKAGFHLSKVQTLPAQQAREVQEAEQRLLAGALKEMERKRRSKLVPKQAVPKTNAKAKAKVSTTRSPCRPPVANAGATDFLARDGIPHVADEPISKLLASNGSLSIGGEPISTQSGDSDCANAAVLGDDCHSNIATQILGSSTATETLGSPCTNSLLDAPSRAGACTIKLDSYRGDSNALHLFATSALSSDGHQSSAPEPATEHEGQPPLDIKATESNVLAIDDDQSGTETTSQAPPIHKPSHHNANTLSLFPFLSCCQSQNLVENHASDLDSRHAFDYS